ncbi:phosphonate C-P lyase system protein PhnL [Ramlibacter sp.]|uniref:phosphonate C-P lyase system protein PhnL n=1 Tax=Ramlibacter sp. TaxID=1917967 RepID=UPI0018083B92|nr:phosphonate C-P lyase system protein PhnL [Ramlibacter sp.]MBA2674540.1 phosphonate C-P lyase system protein PhnL [Ramlibacter sp.]
MTDVVLQVRDLGKTFTLHGRGAIRLPVFGGVALDLAPGECVALTGRSGSGKSSLLRCLYGNYAATSGTVRVRHEARWVDLTGASPREVIAVRRRTLGYVTQFLRVIPRVSALDIVAEPLRRLGHPADAARAEAARWLARLNLGERLWQLPPATFSGGEQQRVNIAHGLIAGHPILLLDEPTASLDDVNREVVVGLIREARERGAAVIGIFHDAEVRDAVATHWVDVEAFRAA